LRFQSNSWDIRIAPRRLGALPVNNATDSHFCRLVGWGNTQEASQHDVVAVYSPQFCNANLPQAFCSIIDSSSQSSCTALQGAPIVCGDSAFVSGFLLNNRECGAAGHLATLEYHSVGEFREWIEEVSGASVAQMSTLVFVLSAAMISATISM
jgi:hypothetical protein